VTESCRLRQLEEEKFGSPAEFIRRIGGRARQPFLKQKFNFLQYNETIGVKIKQLRNKQGLTQDELARRSDLLYTTLTKIESNVITKPSIQTVAKIANGLGIKIDDLIK